jgi:hypothetical protein
LKGQALAGEAVPEKLAARLLRLFWLVVLVAHALLAAAWWYLEPGGFGVGHPRYWANQVAPVLVLGLAIASLAAMRVNSGTALRRLLPTWPAAWAAAAVAGRVLFPITLEWLWLIPLGGSALTGLAAIPSWRRSGGQGRAGAILLGVCAALAGAALTWTQRAPIADTHPCRSLLTVPADAVQTEHLPKVGSLRLDPRVMVHALDGSLTVRLDTITLSVQPLLTFLHGSRDGCWSILARPSDRAGPEPRLRGSQRAGDRSCSLRYDIPGQGSATLRVDADPAPGAIAIDAISRLERLVYSHLNSFCDFEVRGHRRLSLEFSPCQGVPIEVVRSEYPVGRPARFAFVEGSRTFRVVEASSGEKGPFRTLAQGALAAEETLTITLLDQGKAIARLSLADWSSQAGTSLSPTAGWGVPVNAIEFGLSGGSPSSPASIFVTLAGTSVGRGWDCVGHNPGTYCNQIRLETVAADSRSK